MYVIAESREQHLIMSSLHFRTYFHHAIQRDALIYQRLFHTSITRRQNYFDTFKFVERLENEGFTTEQSEVIMNSLQKVISESMQDLTKIMVSKADREKVCV